MRACRGVHPGVGQTTLFIPLWPRTPLPKSLASSGEG